MKTIHKNPKPECNAKFLKMLSFYLSSLYDCSSSYKFFSYSYSHNEQIAPASSDKQKYCAVYTLFHVIKKYTN